MKILVAGGAGYIGSVLIPKLLDRGYKVDVIDLFWFGNQLPPEVGVVNKDIFQLDEGDLAGYDQVIFLGGLSNDPMAEFSPSMNFISNAAAPGEFPNKTPRPSYSVLSGEKLREAGFGTLGTWEQGLEAYLEARAARLRAAS